MDSLNILGADRIEEKKDLGTGDAGLYAFWMAQETIAEKEEKKWVKDARKIVKRYRDERPESSTGSRFNILWSNVQTLIPVYYGKTPKADVKRRFMDQDDVGRYASMLLERSIEYSLEQHGFDDVMTSVVQDRLLPGRGVARILYVPHYGEEIENEYYEEESSDVIVDNKGDEGEEEQPAREVTYEEVVPKYVFWEDYREGPARVWKEVPWIRYRAYMTRDELVERFGPKGKKVTLDFSPNGSSGLSKEEIPGDIYKKAIVHEYWDRCKLEVVWLAPGTSDLILDQLDDPLQLPGFYPSPNPLTATLTNDKRVPVPDYIEYQDQALELDTITTRIQRLTKALKAAGVYPGSEKQVLSQLIDENVENKLIPVEDWQAISEKGGLAGMIEWLPIKTIAETLVQLYAARDKVKQVLYEVTGIADIVRGSTSPYETLGAQQLKSNFATRRTVPQQKMVANFARDIIRLMGAVIAIHFDAKTIGKITGYPKLLPVPHLPPPPPQFIGSPTLVIPGQPVPQPQPNPAFVQWQQANQQVQAITAQNQKLQKDFDDAVALIKKDGLNGFKLDIEADSTITPDEEAEKQARIAFLQQMVPLLQQLVPLAQGNPPLAAISKEVALFAARGFKVARPLEEVLEQAFDAISKMPPTPEKGAKQDTGPSQGELSIKAKESGDKASVALQALEAKKQSEAAANAIESAKNMGELELRAKEIEDKNQSQDRRDAMDERNLQIKEEMAEARIDNIRSREAARLP